MTCGELAGTVAAALLLAGCPGQPAPAAVPFPDDPRVLHGPWRVVVTGLLEGASDLVYASRAGVLVVWFPDGPRAFRVGPDAAWSEVDSAWRAAVAPDQVDPTLEAFVSLELAGSALRIRVTPLDGGPVTVAEVALPAGHVLVAVARGSGRGFALTRDGAGGHHLTWGDAVSGTLVGTRAVASAPDGMLVSSNGRMLALWDLRGRRVTLVDTAEPEVSRDLGLGACRGNRVSEASGDGRWFLYADCFGNLRLADLAAATLGSFALGVGHLGHAAFADDTSEVVWVDAQGVVHAFDPVSGARAELVRLDGDAWQGLDPWDRRVVVRRSADLLAVLTGRGTVRVGGLAGSPASTMATELPIFTLAGAALDLIAGPIDMSGADAYEFTGTFTAYGVGVTGEPLPLEGRVLAPGLHRYLPAPAVAPPPSLHGSASVVDPANALERYRLEFSTTERTAVSFRGLLHDADDETTYRVVVERVPSPAP